MFENKHFWWGFFKFVVILGVFFILSLMN